jgi:uncharacterized repeat protein (TIGR01451 family)
MEVAQPQLEIQTQAPVAVLCSQPVAMNFTVRNTGLEDVKQMQIVNDLPTGMTDAEGNQQIVLDVGCLHAGQSRDFQVEVTSDESGRYQSQARLEGPDGFRVNSNAIATTIKSPDLKVEVNALEQMYAGTRPLAYKVTVHNSGAIVARKIQVWCALPDGAEFVSATDEGSLEDGILAWNLGQLKAQETKVFSFSLQPTELGELQTVLSASAMGMAPEQTQWQTEVKGIAALRLEVADLQDPVQIGELCTYQITVSNLGTAAAESISVKAALPEFLVWDGLGGLPTAQLEDRVVRFETWPELGAGQSVTFELKVRGIAEREQQVQVSMDAAHLKATTTQTETTYFFQ